MSAGAVLSNSVLNLSALREYGRKELTDILDAIPVRENNFRLSIFLCCNIINCFL